MSIDAISATGGRGYRPLDRASAVTPVSATPASAATQTDPGSATAAPSTHPEPPLLLVPTIPLSPTVLAELVGRQISLNGPAAGG